LPEGERREVELPPAPSIEIDEPLINNQNNPQSTNQDMPPRIHQFLTATLAVNLIKWVLVYIIFFVAVDVTLSACKIEFSNAILSAAFEICKISLSALLGYVFGNKVATSK
jgi:hypothetical protein